MTLSLTHPKSNDLLCCMFYLKVISQLLNKTHYYFDCCNRDLFYINQQKLISCFYNYLSESPHLHVSSRETWQAFHKSNDSVLLVQVPSLM